jgi:hypothetical protein
MLRAVRQQRPNDAIAWELNCGEDWRESIGELPEAVAALAFLTRAEVQALQPEMVRGSLESIG